MAPSPPIPRLILEPAATQSVSVRQPMPGIPSVSSNEALGTAAGCGSVAVETDSHLNAVLGVCRRGVGPNTDVQAVTARILSLVLLMQQQAAQPAVWRHGLRRNQLKDVVVHLLQLSNVPRTTEATALLKLCGSVLVYAISCEQDVAEILDEQVFAAIAGALRDEMKIQASRQELSGGDDSTDGGVRLTQTHGEDGTTNSMKGGAAFAASLTKSCLKRKRAASTSQPPRSTTQFDMLAESPDNSLRQGPASVPELKTTSLDAVHARLADLLSECAPFVVDSAVEVSTTSLLCVALHNVLQLDDPGSAEGLPARHSRDVTESSSQLPEQDYYNAREAESRLAAARTRKIWLLRTNSLDVLVQTLGAQIATSLKVATADGLRRQDITPTFEKRCELHRIRLVLQVLEQAAFLAVPAQRQLSVKPDLFIVLLKLIRAMGNVCWGSRAHQIWQPATYSFASLAAEVFLAAMRLLINLTHQNPAANTHVASLSGMGVLFHVFCRLRNVVECDNASVQIERLDGSSEGLLVMEEKLVFDAFLLTMSAMANCVEYSAENRRRLAGLPLPAASDPDPPTANQSRECVCSFLASFFLSRVEPFIRVIESSDGSKNVESTSDWKPDDVILSGCCAFLVGCLMKDSPTNSAAVLRIMPDRSPQLLLRTLSAFIAIHAQIGALTPEMANSVLKVESTLKLHLADTDVLVAGCHNEHDQVPVGQLPLKDGLSQDARQPMSSPAPKTQQRLRNVCSRLCDSESDEDLNGSKMDIAALSEEESTSSAQTSAFASPSRAKNLQKLRLKDKSPVARTPSLKRRRAPLKCARLQDSPLRSVQGSARASETNAVGNASRQLLRGARALLDDLDAEFARSVQHKSDDSNTAKTSFGNRAVSTGLTSSEDTWSRETGDNGGRQTHSSLSSSIEEDDLSAEAYDELGSLTLSSPFRIKKTKPNRTSPSPQPARKKLVRSQETNKAPSTPVRKQPAVRALMRTPPRQSRSPAPRVAGPLPMGESPSRRKLKTTKQPVAVLATAIFDFDD